MFLYIYTFRLLWYYPELCLNSSESARWKSSGVKVPDVRFRFFVIGIQKITF